MEWTQEQRDTVTREDIQDLALEAWTALDAKMHHIATLALAGDRASVRECEDVILATRARADKS